MLEALGLSLGAASVSWVPMDCTGVFDVEFVSQLIDELIEVVDQYAKSGQ